MFGNIPDDPWVLVQRMEDELARQAINRGYSYPAVAEMLGVARRTAFLKKRRACAYDFPLDALTGCGGDRASASEQDSTETATADTAGDDHQHDTGAADSGDAPGGDEY